jgi:hypothetical protein
MFEPDKWTIFPAAIVGAAAALMGLFVVAISVRLDIVTTRRAAATRGPQTLLLLTMPFCRGVAGADPGPARPSTRARVHADGGHFRRRAALEVHGLSPNLKVTIGFVLAGGSLAIEWGGGLYWLYRR